jgi:hypothetical protein
VTTTSSLGGAVVERAEALVSAARTSTRWGERSSEVAERQLYDQSHAPVEFKDGSGRGGPDAAAWSALVDEELPIGYL